MRIVVPALLVLRAEIEAFGCTQGYTYPKRESLWSTFSLVRGARFMTELERIAELDD
jgi:hypothetical protein